MRRSRGSSTPGREVLFSRSASRLAACSRVRVCNVVRKPPRASSTAVAVPNDPAPMTTARRLPGEGSVRWGRAGIASPYPEAARRVTSGSGTPLGQLAAEGLAGRLQLGDGGRHERALEVDDALPERVERVGADDRVQRHPGLAGAGADLADELALERLLVEPSLAGDDRSRGAHALVEAQRVE